MDRDRDMRDEVPSKGGVYTPSEEGNGVRVSNREIYNAVQLLTSQVGRLEGRLSAVDDHETRLRSIERWKNAIPASILVAGAGVIVAILRG